ncbi:MAG: 50S ribosomal protein L22 [Candidatus Micrarchaeaceae archaeon]
MKYSYNKSKEGVAFAQVYDVNASFKDLGAVCDAIRYKKVNDALKILEDVANMERPIEYKKHNKHMGARHELGGRKGAFPQKAAKIVMKTLRNAIANSSSLSINVDNAVVIHACANKTKIYRRVPPRGSMWWGRGMYRAHRMYSDLEFAKVEIGITDNKDLIKEASS